MDRPLDALPEGTKLAGYVIGRVLGRGTFGVTYLAADDLFPDKRFAIKEFLPAGIAMRKAGALTVHPTSPDNVESFKRLLASFRREALTLKELSHPNVVDVQRYIEHNGTAYVVMRYEEGSSLSEALKSGPLSESEFMELLPPLLDGLEAVHAKNFVHRDVKPANIYLRADGSPVLLDFGAAREAIGEERKTSLSEILTPGYAPLEQYDRYAKQGPYTDIYALGATLYCCMTGRPPAEAITRHNALRRGEADPLVPVERAAPGRYSAPLADAVRRSLELDEHKRPQTIAELRALLPVEAGRPATVTAAPASAPARSAARPQTIAEQRALLPVEAGRSATVTAAPASAPARSAAPRRSPKRWALVGSLVAAVGIAALVIVYQPWGPSGPATKEGEPRRPERARVFRDCPLCPEMVVIPAGTFMMGSPAGEDGADEREGPQHRVSFAKPFALGKYEVTLAEWDACVTARGCAERPDDNGWGRDRRPAVNVSWQEAKQYIAWLSRTTKKAYRLPSEAEWEYGARGGVTTRYPWGDEPGSNKANCESCGSEWDNKSTAPVGSFAANGFGLHDTPGNVWELVEDCWNLTHAGAPSDGRVRLTGECGRRVMRGGSWNNHPVSVRSVSREALAPGDRSYDVGFRVAQTLD